MNTNDPIFSIEPIENLWFSSEGRAVQRIYASHLSDVLLVCWEPGQKSSYHNHDISESVVIVLQGELIFCGSDHERCVSVNGIVITPRYVYHQIRNDGPERAVTLHIYTPPLTGDVSWPFRDRTISPIDGHRSNEKD
jgi:quercetin dioxygenase-like cupin family protein